MAVSQSRRNSQSRSFLPPIRSPFASNTNTPRRQREAELLKLLDEYDEKQQIQPTEPDYQQQPQPLPNTVNSQQQQPQARLSARSASRLGEEEEESVQDAEVSGTVEEDENALPHIVNHLASHLSSPYGSFQSQQAIQWLWYVIQHGQYDDSAMTAMLASTDTMPTLSEWIDVALRTSKGSVDKQKRNNLIALLAHITQQPNAQAECAINGLLNTLLVHATTDTQTTASSPSQRSYQPQEEKQQLPPQSPNGTYEASGSAVSRWTSSTDAADMELRQLLWCVLAVLSSHWLCHATIRQSQLLPTLLHYVDAASSRRHWLCHKWQPSELLQLQHYALLALLTIAPTMTELFDRLDGAERLVCFIANITTDEAAEADGKRSAAQRRQLQALAVKCLTDVFATSYASPAHPEVEQLLSTEQSNLRPSSAASTESTSTSASSTTSRSSLAVIIATLLSLVADSRLSLSCRCDALNAVVNLCAERREHRRGLGRQRGVELVAAMLADESAVVCYVSQCPQLVAALLSCVWRCIVPSNTSTSTFLACHGLDSLLVLITRAASHSALQHQTLSCLADLLLQHTASRQHFHNWSHRLHLPSLLPNQPQSIAVSLATSASAQLPAVSALDLMLALWPAAAAADGGAMDRRRVVYSVLSGCGFDEFVGATATQRGQLAWIAAFPFQCELRVWSELINDMAASGQWDELVDEDRERALSIRAALEAQMLAAQQYCDAMSREQLAADEQELAGYLAVLNEQRIELTRRMLTTPQFALSTRPFSHSLSQSSAAPHTSRSPLSSRLAPSKPVSGTVQQPSGSALLSAMQRGGALSGYGRSHAAHRHNNSLYGRYRPVEVMVAPQPHIAESEEQ